MKTIKILSTILMMIFVLTKSFSQTIVTIGGGATISCPTVPLATWTTPPSGVTISNWSRGSGVTCQSASNGLAGSGFQSGTFNSNFSSNRFFSTTITTNSTTSITLTSVVWVTTLSSGTCTFTVGYINNSGTFTTFGTTNQTSTSSNTFTGSVTISPNTSLTLYLIPVTTSNSATVRWRNSSTLTLSGPSISTTGTLTSMTTTYGTASSSKTFSVSGTNMQSGITITPPQGLEVSTSNTFTTIGTNTNPIVVGSSGNIPSTTIYVRLSANAIPNTYNSQNINLTSTSATTKTISTSSSGNIVNTKTLTIISPQVTTKSYDGTNSATITGTLSGIIGSDIVNLVGTGTFTSENVGTGLSVTSTSTLSGTHSNRYTLTQPTGLTGIIVKANQTISFNALLYKSTFDVDFIPNASSTSNLSLTYTSSDPSVATIVSGKIKIMGIGTSTITASQTGNGNYNAAVSVSTELVVSDPISRWSFDAITISGTGQTPTITSSIADIGIQTENTSVSGFHTSSSTAWTQPNGNGNSKSISSNNWQLGDYYRYNVNTQYTTIIRLSFDQTSSPTGPKDFKLQYSLDGTNFTDITNYQIPFNTSSNLEYSWSATTFTSSSTLSFDLSSVTEINDQPNVQFRMVNTSTSALLGGTIQSLGTSRMDNFTTFGNMDIPLPLNIISFSGKSFGTQNRLSWTLSEWGLVKIQKLINNKWVEIGQTDNNFWFDTNTQRGLNYYRIVSDKTFSRPIYINNELGQSLSEYSFKYYDLTGKSVNNTEPGKIHIRKSEFNSEKIIVQ